MAWPCMVASRTSRGSSRPSAISSWMRTRSSPVNNSVTDVYWMLGFGIFGYFMRHYGYPLGPVILGVILSRLLDDNWRRAIISEREDLGRFFEGIATSPLSLILFLSVILIFVSQTPLWALAKGRGFAGGKRSVKK